ncbi:MAG: hypothetical protein NT027_12150 [Proteobacteria bacterium]|nr:hypothetical protein [Pseudomonadota bacterium]
MKALVAQALANNPLANQLQAYILVLFVGIFFWIIYKTFRPASQKQMKKLADELIKD